MAFYKVEYKVERVLDGGYDFEDESWKFKVKWVDYEEKLVIFIYQVHLVLIYSYIRLKFNRERGVIYFAS